MSRFIVGAVWVPWVSLGVSVGLALVAVALGLSGDADLVIVFSFAALGLVFGVVGALIVSGSSGNVVGWIFCAFALLMESSILGDAYVAYESAAGGFLPGRTWVAWTNQWLNNALAPALVILCFLLFPTGRLPSARWRPVLWLVAVAAAVHAASAALAPGVLADYGVRNPVGVESAPVLRTVADASIQVLIVPLIFLSVVSLFVRLRRSSGVERLQLKWFAYAAALLAANLVASNVLDFLFGGALDRAMAERVSFLAFVTTLSAIPVAMGVAILRYRLYDIDRIINRTLVYGALTVSLALVYFGSVASLQYAFRAATGVADSRLIVVASTLAIAALFSPLRRRVQAFIDRRFYRKKYDAARTLDAFSARMRDQTDLDELGGNLLGVVRTTLQPEHASLWLRPGERPR